MRGCGQLHLVYRGSPLIIIDELEDGTVEVRTRAYSEGYQTTRHMTTEALALRYASAWVVKWRGQAKADVKNRIASAAAIQAAAEADRGRSPPMSVAKRPTRRRR